MDEVTRELLTDMVSSWTPEQVDKYIKDQETRIISLTERIRFLKEIRRKKTTKKVVETGARDGR